jgi:lysophospholipase L1-like esterase
MKVRPILFLSVLLASVFFAQPAQAAAPTVTPVVRVMPLGDSITYGVGSSTTSSYRAELWRRVAEQNGYGIDFVGSVKTGVLPDQDNEGHSGWTIAQVAAQATAWVQTYQPGIVLLHLGTNDVKDVTRAVGAPERLSALIDQIRAAAPGVVVVVAQIVPSKNDGVDTRAREFNAQLPAIVASKGSSVRLVDLYSPLSRTTDMFDTLHPNDSGFVKMAAGWQPALQAALPIPNRLSARNVCLDVPSSADGTQAKIWTCVTHQNQRVSRDGTNLRLHGKCLDLSGTGTANRTPVVLAVCNGSAGQSWTLRDDGTVYNTKAARCLDIPAGDTTPGTKLSIYSCGTSLNQRWSTV